MPVLLPLTVHWRNPQGVKFRAAAEQMGLTGNEFSGPLIKFDGIGNSALFLFVFLLVRLLRVNDRFLAQNETSQSEHSTPIALGNIFDLKVITRRSDLAVTGIAQESAGICATLRHGSMPPPK